MLRITNSIFASITILVYVPCAYSRFKNHRWNALTFLIIDGWFNSFAARFLSINSDRFDIHSIRVSLKQFFLSCTQFNNSTLTDRFQLITIPTGCVILSHHFVVTRSHDILRFRNAINRNKYTMNGKVCDSFFFRNLKRLFVNTCEMSFYLETQITEKIL